MAYNFPDAPTVGQLFQGYIWDGEKWMAQNVTPQGAVRYDIVQGLSTPQQVQARANIGAGPVLPADTAWTPYSYRNGWVDYGAPYSPCGYRKLANGLVVLRGLVMSGTATTIMNLPAGYRPSITYLFGVQTSPNVLCRIDIGVTGDMTHTGGSNGWISLAGITFLAEN